MSSSSINFNQRPSFWVDDAIMQVACYGIVRTIDFTDDSDKNWMKRDFRDHLFNVSQGIFIGFIHLRLDEFLTNQQRFSSFSDCLKKTENYFKNKGSLISIEELNEFQKIAETKREWIHPLETLEVIQVLKNLADLIKTGTETELDLDENPNL